MKRFWNLFGPRGEQGSIVPVVALGLAALVGAMALGIDLGQLQVVRNELQNVADAAALAGAKKLIQDTNNDGVAEVTCAAAIQAAKDYVNKNYSLGSTDPLVVKDADVAIGFWDLATKTFTARTCGDSTKPTDVNAVQVTVRREGESGGNAKVSTFLGSAMGVGTRDRDPETGLETGPAKLTVAACATAMLGLAGTSSVDLPFSIPDDYLPGAGLASNGLPRILEKLSPGPAYAATPKSYRWKDLGGNNPMTSDQLKRATFVVPTQGEQANNYLVQYLKGPDMSGGKRFPQKKVGDQLWPMSEWYWGSYVKPTMQALKDRFNDSHTPKPNGKWRVTVPVFNTTSPAAAVPQNSWFKLASRLIPGVSQAYACTAYSPAVFTQGFATVDVTNVYVKSDCLTSGDQVTQTNSCRNTCYMDIEVPLDQNTLSTDKGSTPIPSQKDYKDMNPSATEVGVFASVPRIVK